MNDRIQNRIAAIDDSIISAMKQMDREGVKLLFIYSDSLFMGLLTIGDIQRAIISGHKLSEPISSILNKDKIYASEDDSEKTIQSEMRRLRAECMPVVNSYGQLVKVYFWEDLFEKTPIPSKEEINLPVVIMAGGKGSRLKPLTNVIPKPLIPVGDKTILEEIMDQFESIGCRKFYMSVNYKVEMMKFYLSKLNHHYDINFFQEEKPMGTIGSVSMLKGIISTPFIVSNCDIIIDQDYRDVYEYHIKNQNDITLVAAVKSERIPYGVIESGDDGLLKELKEKPDSSFMFNTGVYILNPELINEIPENKVFHITQLINTVKDRGGRVGCFPVSENAWHDMGEWDEYLRFIGK